MHVLWASQRKVSMVVPLEYPVSTCLGAAISRVFINIFSRRIKLFELIFFRRKRFPRLSNQAGNLQTGVPPCVFIPIFPWGLGRAVFRLGLNLIWNFGWWEPPTPWIFQWLSMGWVWIVSSTEHFISSDDCTIGLLLHVNTHLQCFH